MPKRKPATAAKEWVDADDAPELTAEFFARADLYEDGKLVRRGRPPTGRAKQAVSLRVDKDVLAALRATPGWQARANDALRRLVGLAEEPAANPHHDPARSI